MRKAKILFSIFSIIVLGAASLSARPAIWPPETSFEQKNFLLLPNIPEMNVDFALLWTDSAASLFIAPFDAVVLHVVVNGEPKDVFVISDIGMQRLTLWQCSAPGLTGERTLESITTYKGEDCGGLRSPSGIATNAINRLFDPNFDVIYLCDRGNDRILELSYQPNLSGGEIRFVRSIGQGVLEWPVDVAISAYGDANQNTADLYVVDMGHIKDTGKLSRFSISGIFEGSWNKIGHPGYEQHVIWTLQNPIAVSCFPDSISGSSAIYIADATIGTLFFMRAETNTSPSFADQYDYAWGNRIRQPGGVAEDDYGRIYAVNYGTGTIGIFGPMMWYIDPSFGAPANDPNALYYPTNIILDTYYGQCEALILELYGRQSGLRSFIISNGSSTTKPPLGFQGLSFVKPVVSSSAPLPGQFSLNNAYPNPFNSECVISFSLPNQSQVRLEVFNLLGQRVASLVDEVKPAGQHSVHFKADGVSSGVYFYRLKADGFSETKSIVLLK